MIIRKKIRDNCIIVRKDRDSIVTMRITGGDLQIRFTELVSNNNPIVITKKEGKVLFDNLAWFMSQRYYISHPEADGYEKEDNHFIWKSDIPALMGDNVTARLVINRDKDYIAIAKRIPKMDDECLRHASGVVVLDSAIKDDGFNINTGKSIRDDFIKAIQCSINNNRVGEEKESILKKIFRRN